MMADMDDHSSSAVHVYSLVIVQRAGAVGTSTVFWLYAVACVVSVVFIATCVPETKDKSLEQIDDAIAMQQQRILRLYAAV